MARLGICILFDAILFVLWLGIAWGAESIAQLIEAHGVHEYCAVGFKWASSGATFILTMFYIVHDIIAEFRRIFLGHTVHL